MFTPGYKPPLISRIEYPESRSRPGWQLRIRRGRKRAEPFFADADFENDPIKSLRAAEEHRDTIIVDFPVMAIWERAKTVRSNSSSGVTGVCWSPAKKRKKGSLRENVYFRVQARIQSLLIGWRYRSWTIAMDDLEAQDEAKTLGIAQRLKWNDELRIAEEKTKAEQGARANAHSRHAACDGSEFRNESMDL